MQAGGERRRRRQNTRGGKVGKEKGRRGKGVALSTSLSLGSFLSQGQLRPLAEREKSWGCNAFLPPAVPRQVPAVKERVRNERRVNDPVFAALAKVGVGSWWRGWPDVFFLELPLRNYAIFEIEKKAEDTGRTHRMPSRQPFLLCQLRIHWLLTEGTWLDKTGLGITCHKAWSGAQEWPPRSFAATHL